MAWALANSDPEESCLCLSRKFHHPSRQSAFHRIPRAIQNQETYILFNGPRWPVNRRASMNTTSRIRFTALTIAVAVTALLQGTMLWSFDTVAQQADQTATQVTMKTVTSPNS